MNRIWGFKVAYAYALVFAVACLDSSVFAAGWQIDPYLKATASFDDNTRFSIDNPKESSVGIFELGADFKNESEVVKTQVSPRVRYSGYASDDDLSNDAQFLDFSTRSNGERSTPSLEIKLSRDSALGELDAEDASLSRVLVNEQRNRWSVKPAWSYKLTERDALDVSLAVDSVSYDDIKDQNLSDYVNQVADIAYVRSLDEIKDFTARLSQTQYEADQRGTKADTTGVELGLSNEFTERTRGSFFVGFQNTDSELGFENENPDLDGKKESNSGYTVKAIVDHESEATKASVNLSRGVVPSLEGNVRNQTSLRVDFDREVNLKLGWGIDLLLQRNEVVNSSETDEDLNYYYFEPSLKWSLTHAWKLVGTYRVSLREFDQSREEADRNELGLSIEYRRPPREQIEQFEQEQIEPPPEQP